MIEEEKKYLKTLTLKLVAELEKLVLQKRRTLPNYGYSDEGLKSLSESMSKTMMGRIPWNNGLTKYDHPSIMKYALERTIYFDKVKYSKGWDEVIKSQVRELYGYSCNVCGRTRGLLVHHKDLSKDNHELDNLELLCRSCHAKLHGRLWNNLAMRARNSLKEVLVR